MGVAVAGVFEVEDSAFGVSSRFRPGTKERLLIQRFALCHPTTFQPGVRPGFGAEPTVPEVSSNDCTASPELDAAAALRRTGNHTFSHCGCLKVPSKGCHQFRWMI